MVSVALSPWQEAGLLHIYRPGKAATAPLPEVYFSALSKIPATASTLWTYYELGDDLGGKPDPERRTALANCLSQTQLPKGTVCFLPFTHRSESENLQIHPGFFWSALAKTTIRSIVFFGQPGWNELFPVLPDLFTSSEMILYALRITHLPPLSACAAEPSPLEWEEFLTRIKE